MGALTTAVGVLVLLAGLALAAGVLDSGGGLLRRPELRLEVPATPTNLIARLASNSPMLMADPTDSRFVVLANRTDSPNFGCALQVSGDGGHSWESADPVPRLPAGAQECYAPEVAFDRTGVLYYLFVGLQGKGNTPIGAFLEISVDRGRSFSAPRKLLAGTVFQVRMAIDPTLGVGGRLHLVWIQGGGLRLGGFATPLNPIMSAYSDDRGRTFSAPVQVNDPNRRRVVAPALAVGRDHEVHVLYYDLGDDSRDYEGLAGPIWKGRWSLVMATSTDGGVRFDRSTVVDAVVVPPERVMLIFTMPPPSLVADGAGRVYAAWDDARNGDWDVFLRRSHDDGRSWGSAQRLNDDPLHDGSNQYLPRLSLSSDGRLDAIWYDRRNNAENRGNDVYYAYSTDHGASFSRNIRLTSLDSDSEIGQVYAIPSALGPPLQHEFGSRIALLSQGSRTLAAWADTRNTGRAPPSQDIFSRQIAFTSSGEGAWTRLLGAAVALLALAGLALRHRGVPRRTPADR